MEWNGGVTIIFFIGVSNWFIIRVGRCDKIFYYKASLSSGLVEGFVIIIIISTTYIIIFSP